MVEHFVRRVCFAWSDPLNRTIIVGAEGRGKTEAAAIKAAEEATRAQIASGKDTGTCFAAHRVTATDQKETKALFGLKEHQDLREGTTFQHNGDQVFRFTGSMYFPLRPIEIPSILAFHLCVAYHEKRRVRISYGDHKTGKDWLCDTDVEGYVKRSSGELCSPILVHNKASTGGSVIPCENIIKLEQFAGKSRNDGVTFGWPKKRLWAHPNYHRPALRIRPVSRLELDSQGLPLRLKGYTHHVLADEKPHATFKSESAAKRYLKKFN